VSVCACGSQLHYEACCGRFLELCDVPQTPETLMRSRYTAYSRGNMSYIKNTMKYTALQDFNETPVTNIIWVGLKIVNVSVVTGNQGFVEFIAHYIEDNHLQSLHEISRFHFDGKAWFYMDGEQRETKGLRIQRNMICPCGSKKKFKRCHGVPMTLAR